MKQWRKAIFGTIGAIGIWIAAVISLQPNVTPPPLPLERVGQTEWSTSARYQDVFTVSGVVYRIDIPKGFRCDLASIGDILAKPLGIDRDHPAIRRGALIHDWSYRTGIVSKETADLILYQACLADGMEPSKARAVYEAVRLWGFTAKR